jgi:hypothetical protein
MGFQLIPLAMLGAYILYASYYYATPMFFLKVMLFLAHIRYRDIDIHFEERRITARYSRDGEEYVVTCRIDENQESRFWPMTACSAFRRMLRDIRKGRLYESDPAEAENGESGAVGDRSDN